MRWAVRFALSASALALILLLLLKNHVEDIWDQYSIGAYIGSSWRNSFQDAKVQNHQDNPSGPSEAGDKVIIMAKLEKEDTNWVMEHLPDWQAAIYTVNPTTNTTSGLTTPVNKGHEAMAYLSYIIDNYDTLPSTLAFIHSHRDGFLSAWHTDTPHHDNVDALHNLQLPFVQSNGYVNLRCNWNPGCVEAHRDNAHVTSNVWLNVFKGTTTENMQYPVQVGACCCAQFAVSRDQVRQRPLNDYQHFRDWIVHTEESDAKSGRVLEFLWHVIFGKAGVYCPTEEKCYCDVYGRC